MNYELSHLETLEAEAIHVFREVAAEFERPVLLFSGGKDSIVMLHLAIKAFWPARMPFPLMHIDTGHNFDEVYEFRDRTAEEQGLRLVVASVQPLSCGSSSKPGFTTAPKQPKAAAPTLMQTSSSRKALTVGTRKDSPWKLS